MPRKSYKPEEIVAKLRPVDVITALRPEGLKVPARPPKRARLVAERRIARPS